MQAYQPENNTSPDPIRRILLGAFLLSAVVTLLLAFCSRKTPAQPTPVIVGNGTVSTIQQSNQAQPTLDDNRLLQTNANRPGYKDLNLDQTVYFLLTGLDKREWEEDAGPGLTDTIIVAFLDAQEEKAGLISIPRDTWVDVPDYGSYKINQAFSLGEAYGYSGGGPGILMDTAGNLLGVEIDYYVQVDFEAFVILVDAVNGVLVDVPREILVWPNAKMEGDMKRIILTTLLVLLVGGVCVAQETEPTNLFSLDATLWEFSGWPFLVGFYGGITYDCVSPDDCCANDVSFYADLFLFSYFNTPINGTQGVLFPTVGLGVVRVCEMLFSCKIGLARRVQHVWVPL